MSEYYAEHDSIMEISEQITAGKSQMTASAAQIEASRKALVKSKSIEGLGYGYLVDKTRTGVSKLAKREKQISNVLKTVSNLYADYEGKVISALDDSISAGNNFSAESRYETRDASDSHVVNGLNGARTNAAGSGAAASSTSSAAAISQAGTQTADNSITDYINPTPEQKRRYVHDYLERTHPDLLEQIYDRLHGNGAVAAGAVAAGVGGIAAQAAGAGGSGYSTGSVSGPTRVGTTAGGGAAGGGAAGTSDAGAGGASAGSDGGASGGGAESGGGAGSGGGTGGATGGGAGSGGGTGGGAGSGGAGEESDWIADALNDAVDSDMAQAAQGAIGEVAATENPAASATGAGALDDSSSMGFATDAQSGFAQLMSDFGSNFIEAVQKYGLSAGIIVGGAGAAYASNGAATEAVAHCAEFVSTRCVPGVQDFMRQASNAINVTRVSLRMTLGNIIQGVSGLAR